MRGIAPRATLQFIAINDNVNRHGERLLDFTYYIGLQLDNIDHLMRKAQLGYRLLMDHKVRRIINAISLVRGIYQSTIESQMNYISYNFDVESFHRKKLFGGFFFDSISFYLFTKQ